MPKQSMPLRPDECLPYASPACFHSPNFPFSNYCRVVNMVHGRSTVAWVRMNRLEIAAAKTKSMGLTAPKQPLEHHAPESRTDPTYEMTSMERGGHASEMKRLSEIHFEA